MTRNALTFEQEMAQYEAEVNRQTEALFAAEAASSAQNEQSASAAISAELSSTSALVGPDSSDPFGEQAYLRSLAERKTVPCPVQDCPWEATGGSWDIGGQVCIGLCFGVGFTISSVGLKPYVSGGVGWPSLGGGAQYSAQTPSGGWSLGANCAWLLMTASVSNGGAEIGAGTYASTAECSAGFQYGF
jgi:hypothetical protein